MANVKISALPAATIFRLASQVPESEGTSTTYKSTGAQILSTFLQSLQYDVMLSPYAVTTANLTATYDNGIAGVGATLTNSGAQAAFATDGVSPPINSLILVWQQSSGLQNGPYLLTTVGTGATNWVLTRPTWWDASDEINQYQLFSVLNGTLYANETFQYIGISSPTVGTTELPFSLFQLVLPSDIQNMTFSSGVTSGTGSAYTVDISPTPDGLHNFQLFEIQFHTGNSDSPTININGFGAIDLINNDGDFLPASAISSSGYIGLVAVTNSGTSLTLLNPAAPPPIVTPAQIQNQAFIYGTDDGAVDAFHASFTPVIASYVTGQRFSIAVADANTGACTFEAEALTPKPIVMADGSTPPVGAIVADSIMDIEYTASSNFQLMNPFVTSYVTPEDIQNQAYTYGFAGGTPTAYTSGFTPVLTALQDGQMFLIQFNAPNGDSPTIEFDSLGAIPIIDQAGVALEADAIPVADSFGLVAICQNEAAAMLITLYPPAGAGVSPLEIQEQAFTFEDDSSTGPDAYVVDFTPALPPTDGTRFDVRINSTGANTITNPTITVNSAPYTIYINDGANSPIAIGDILSNMLCSFEIIDGVVLLLNPARSSDTDLTLLRAQLSGDQTGIAASTTVDIAFDTAPINIGGMLNTTTYEWTADAAGNYIHSVAVAGNQGTATSAPALRIVSDLNGTVANAGFGNSVTIGGTYFNGGILPITIPAVAGEVFKVEIENLDAVNIITVNGGQPSTFWTIIDDNGGGSPSLTYPIVSQKVATDTAPFAYTTANDQVLIFDSIEGTSPIMGIYNSATGTITIPSGQQFIWQLQLQGLADTANITNVRFYIASPFTADFNFTQPVAVTGGVQVSNSFTGAIQAGATVQVLFDASGSGNWVNGASFAQGNTTYLQITRLGPT